MDNANSPLARGSQPLHHSLAGTNARTGESSVMKAISTAMGRGRDTLPLQPYPKNETQGRLHRRFDTPLQFIRVSCSRLAVGRLTSYRLPWVILLLPWPFTQLFGCSLRCSATSSFSRASRSSVFRSDRSA